jgi:hypothetical protein
MIGIMKCGLVGGQHCKTQKRLSGDIIPSCGQLIIFLSTFWWHRRLAGAAQAKACGYQK